MDVDHAESGPDDLPALRAMLGALKSVPGTDQRRQQLATQIDKLEASKAARRPWGDRLRSAIDKARAKAAEVDSTGKTLASCRTALEEAEHKHNRAQEQLAAAQAELDAVRAEGLRDVEPAARAPEPSVVDLFLALGRCLADKPDAQPLLEQLRNSVGATGAPINLPGQVPQVVLGGGGGLGADGGGARDGSGGPPRQPRPAPLLSRRAWVVVVGVLAVVVGVSVLTFPPVIVSLPLVPPSPLLPPPRCPPTLLPMPPSVPPPPLLPPPP
ncbi:MAG: hypothetical protein V2I33_24925, partial [Kangiellaceae bacterium]|nr:hypothetical protein [Kangiellaceae bacterium]